MIDLKVVTILIKKNYIETCILKINHATFAVLTNWLNF
jgi:hypothetical protein